MHDIHLGSWQNHSPDSSGQLGSQTHFILTPSRYLAATVARHHDSGHSVPIANHRGPSTRSSSKSTRILVGRSSPN